MNTHTNDLNVLNTTDAQDKATVRELLSSIRLVINRKKRDTFWLGYVQGSTLTSRKTLYCCSESIYMTF